MPQSNRKSWGLEGGVCVCPITPSVPKITHTGYEKQKIKRLVKAQGGSEWPCWTAHREKQKKLAGSKWGLKAELGYKTSQALISQRIVLNHHPRCVCPSKILNFQESPANWSSGRNPQLRRIQYLRGGTNNKKLFLNVVVELDHIWVKRSVLMDSCTFTLLVSRNKKRVSPAFQLKTFTKSKKKKKLSSKCGPLQLIKLGDLHGSES